MNDQKPKTRRKPIALRAALFEFGNRAARSYFNDVHDAGGNTATTHVTTAADRQKAAIRNRQTGDPFAESFYRPNALTAPQIK